MKKIIIAFIAFSFFFLQSQESKATCHAEFSWDKTYINQISFTTANTGSYNPAYSFWRFGDGTTLSSAGNPIKTYPTSGNYGVSLILRDSLGSICDSVYHLIRVDSCFGEFRITYQCGDSINIEVQHGLTTIANIRWGDGTSTWTGMGASWNIGYFGHRYSTGGIKNIELAIPMFFGPCSGISDTFRGSTTIYPAPSSGFRTSQLGDSVSCLHTAGGLSAPMGGNNFCMSWWNFGDGPPPFFGEVYPDTISGHRYSTPGTYIIKHWVTTFATSGPYCASDTTRDTITIGCFAYFTGSLPSTYTSSTLPVYDVLTNHSSTSTTSMNYWLLDGVGIGSTTGSASLFTMPINTYGTHDICLIVYDPTLSCYDSFCTTITVSAPSPCVASFTAATGSSGLAVFTNASSATYARWNFGDGSSSFSLSPSHTYLANGIYTVCLYVSNVSPTCCYCDTICNIVVITTAPLCTAYFYDSLATGYTHYFSNYSVGSTNFLWSFGDGSSSTLRSPYHTYSSPGTYNVCVYIRADTSSAWCDTFCRTVVIGGCNADYTAIVHCSTLEFINASSGGHSYGWDFGDGSPIDTAANPIHTYSDTGVHIVYVTLYVYDTAGNICDSMRRIWTYYTYDTLSGFVWNDANGDGFKDAGESYRSGQAVNLYDASGITLLATVYTNSVGAYQFTFLRAGAYRVVLGALPSSHYQSYPAAPPYYDATSTGSCINLSNLRFGVIDSSMYRIYISGYVYEDNNNNGVKDIGEPGLSGERVYIGSYSVITNSSGFYYVVVPNTTYTISYFMSAAYAGYSYTTPAALNLVPIAGTYGYANNNFGINDTVVVRNLCAELIPYNGLNAYTSTLYLIRVWNHSSVPMDGAAVMNYDPAFTYNYSSPIGVHDGTAHSITWTFTGIPAHSYRSYLAAFLPVTAPIGTTVFNMCEVTSSSGSEIEYECNIDTMHQVVGVSYDPNDKLVTPVGEGPDGQINANTELSYTIRFQNTGTAAAVNVILVDQIDANLDMETFELTAASHDVRTQMLGRTVKFYFDDIMLPDSASDPIASKGYVKYKIHTVPFLADGATINNNADIFFDLNPPIRTNTTLNTISYKLSIDKVTEDIHFNAYPNPFENVINFSMDGMQNGKASIVLYDVQGKLTLQKDFDAKNSFTKIQLQTDGLSNAVYLYQLVQNGKVLSEGKLIRH